MDVETLVSAVFTRAALWDKRLKSHSNRNVTQRLWNEIAAEMEMDENVLRKKWKYLRDQFAVELGKLPKPRSGDSAPDSTSKWPYFHSLLFLKDIVKARVSTGNCSTETNTQTQIENENSQGNEGTNEVSNDSVDSEINTQQNEDNGTSQINETNEIETNNGGKKIVNNTPKLIKRKRETETWNEQMINIEKQKLEYLTEKAKRSQVTEKDDDHASFFKSLLPFVRKIPENEILSFRGSVQQLVEEFLYKRSRSNSSTSLSSSSMHTTQGMHMQAIAYTPQCTSAQHFEENAIYPPALDAYVERYSGNH